jgi:hypothetical protein
MRNLDKYIEYVLAQVLEGGHTKEEVEEDLLERGLLPEEVDYVMQGAWSEGQEIEKSSKDNVINYLLVACSIPLAFIILNSIAGIFPMFSLKFLLIILGLLVTSLYTIFTLKKKIKNLR